MSKQEKAARKGKAAAQKAAVIVEEAVAKVKAKRGEATEEDVALGHKVKELRDTGMAWWQIAHELGLPGSADNVAQGKSGASKARRLYAAAYGSHPSTPRGPRTVDDGSPKPRGKRSRTGAIKRVEGGSMFAGATDEEIVVMVGGKQITWENSLSPGLEESALVHKGTPINIVESKQGRALEFRTTIMETSSDADRKFNFLAGPWRTVVLDRIVKVG